MSALLRDAPVGQIIRWVTKNRVLQYPEEKPGFVCPNGYQGEKPSYASDASTPIAGPPVVAGIAEKLEDPGPPGANLLTTAPTVRDVDPFDHAGAHESLNSRTLSKVVSRHEMSKTNTRADLEQAYTNAMQQESIKSQQSRPIMPEKTADGVILVDWYETNDQENPQNWSSKKKGFAVLQIYLYTLAVYIGSAIYTPSEPYLIKIFGISPTVASLGLALYVLGYGTGPLFFSPLSEIPVIGRNPPYMITFGIFVILCIPTALVNDVPGFLVLRFLQGFFGSPCLATGGASIGDLYSLIKLPYYLTGWAAFATAGSWIMGLTHLTRVFTTDVGDTCVHVFVGSRLIISYSGPALGPLISGFSVPVKNWHWSLWEILWLSGPVFVSLMFFLPETSSSNILLRRAERLRKITGNQNLKSQSEIDQAKLTVNEVIISNLWRPFQINIQDPAVLFTSVYVALIYGIYYSFFEVFPIVYGPGGYGMNLGQLGLIFLCILVAVLIAIPSYWSYLYWIANPEILTKGLPPPEKRLIPAIYASVLAPVGLFIFAWTGNHPDRNPWIAPTIGISVYTIGIFLMIQCLFVYIPLSYAQYTASLFAANDFARSALATGAILFARPLFINLGVGRGVTLLAGLTVGGVVGILWLYYYGAALRARSKYTAK